MRSSLVELNPRARKISSCAPPKLAAPHRLKFWKLLKNSAAPRFRRTPLACATLGQLPELFSIGHCERARRGSVRQPKILPATVPWSSPVSQKRKQDRPVY